MKKKVISCALSAVMGCSMILPSLSGCTPSATKDTIVIMAEEMSGLFNPYYATSGADMDVVGLTQIGMLSTDSLGKPVAGDSEATVVKSFNYETIGTGEDAQTVYTFVIKNGLKFSDGQPLTMEDVLFNMYIYLDPSYTGSSTMYSTDIVGLQEYRLQKPFQSDTAASQEAALVEKETQKRAADRIELLKKIFERVKENEGLNVMASQEMMKAAINGYNFSNQAGYKNAVLESYNQTGKDNAYYQAQLLEDYEHTVETFRDELVADFKAAKESFDTTTAPYKDHANLLKSDVFKFFLYEGYITPNYAKLPNSDRDDKTKIEDFGNYEHYTGTYETMDAAIDYVLKDWITTKLDQVLSWRGTAGTLKTEYAATAMDIYLHELLVQAGGSEDSLKYPNISGIVSLGHSTNQSSITFKDYTTGESNTWKIAQEHNEDGTPKNRTGANAEYDVLQITVNGTDPKAIYNFGFTVAPSHYYGATEGTEYEGTVPEINIESNQFGVPWADSAFQSKVVQSARNVEVPMGAGPFKATNANNGDNPSGSQFWSSNVVYYKANDNFMFDVKAEKLRMQVVSSTNAIGQLESGAVDYITPQMTADNYDKLTALSSKGMEMLDSWQLGYGYIGINAGKIPDVNIRKAIMSAMQVELACAYYRLGSCIPIAYPMSKVSWAYPKEAATDVTSENLPYAADKNWVDWTDVTPDAQDANKSIEEKFPNAVKEFKEYMQAANVTAGSSKLEITFTIAGASITEHPTYNVFRQAADILNACGWDVEVKADSQALTKLATGSLAVWAAAWGSTVDPDMYQVYHMESSATSTYAWGYREIKAGGESSVDYGDEYALITELSKLIDEGRETMDEASRTQTYKKALELVLDLAVEMPVYQRKTLYAYNSKTVKGFSNSVNPYSSPLEKIWELELINN